MPNPEFHSQTIKEVQERLKVDLKRGLSSKEAQERLLKFGPNKLPEEKPLAWVIILLNQFKSPLIFILLIAAIICFALQEFVDMGVILAAVALNAIVGFFQENKAERALFKLKTLIEREAKVLRDGIEHEIKAEKVVVGDILFLDEGDKIPADARVIESHNLNCVEAPLTGESIPSVKTTEPLEAGIPLADRENMVYMGCQIERGRGKAVVTATGLNTQLGQIAALVKRMPEEATPLQLRMARLGRNIGLIILGVCVLILLGGILTGRPFFDMFLTSVAVAVAAIPEGLPLAMTVALALGMQRMLKKKALTRKLIAAETLGSITAICSDKTGTLTRGIMAVAYVLPALNKEETRDLCLKIGLLCNNAFIENPEEELKRWKIFGDPTEKALLLAGQSAGMDKMKLEEEIPRLDEIPFEADKKFMATLHKEKGKNIIYIKGAPEVILNWSKYVHDPQGIKKLTSRSVEKFKSQYEQLTKKGLRVLACGYKEFKGDKITDEDCQDLVFVGFQALKDPLRAEAKVAIKKCLEAGIRPIIITGDHKLTAQAIAKEAGIGAKEENILTGDELEKMSDEELKRVVKKITVYARISPKQKVRIGDALQARGEVIAMVGDGVNDAPALKGADIGVALGSGTEVAKETSDMILLDNNFKTIVAAVKQGRTIFDNIRKVTLYLLSDSFSEVILIAGALLLGFPLPLLPAQILWINLVEDGLPDFALAFEPGERDVMAKPPRKKKEPILNQEMKVLIFIIGLVTDLVLLAIFWWLWHGGFDIGYIRTIIFAALGVDSLIYVFSCRSLRKSILHIPLFSNLYLLGAVAFGWAMLLLALYNPFLQRVLRVQALGGKEWLLLLAIGLFEIIAIEFGKWIFIHKEKKEHVLS